jgi:hypothetical protein
MIIVRNRVVGEVFEKVEFLGVTEHSIRVCDAGGLSLDEALTEFGHA